MADKKTLTRINPKTDKPYTQLELAQAHIEALNARIAGFQDAITQISREWKPLVHELVGELKTAEQRAALRQLQFLSGELRKQLNGLGYQKLAEKIVTGYDDSIAYAENAADFAIVGPTPMQIPIPKDALLHVRELDLSAYEQIGNDAIRTLSKQLTMDVMVGVPRNKMLQALDEVLDKEFMNKANLYVDTATRQYDRTVTMNTWKEAGIATFKYFGPKDNKNRVFCAEHVGKVYTLEEIQKMKNDQSLPVLVYGGGWRCRHTWQPFQDERNRYPEQKKRKGKTSNPQQNLFE